MDDDPSDRLVNKYFDPIMNAPDYESIRRFLRADNNPDELEQFALFWGWKYFEDRRALVFQEIARMRAMPRTVMDTVEMKPGFQGFSVDLKMLGKWVRQRLTRPK